MHCIDRCLFRRTCTLCIIYYKVNIQGVGGYILSFNIYTIIVQLNILYYIDKDYDKW